MHRAAPSTAMITPQHRDPPSIPHASARKPCFRRAGRGARKELTAAIMTGEVCLACGDRGRGWMCGGRHEGKPTYRYTCSFSPATLHRQYSRSRVSCWAQAVRSAIGCLVSFHPRLDNRLASECEIGDGGYIVPSMLLLPWYQSCAQSHAGGNIAIQVPVGKA